MSEQHNLELIQSDRINGSTAEQKKHQRNIILMQCVGLLCFSAYQNGVAQAYASSLTEHEFLIWLVVTLPMLLLGIGVIPFAYFSDRFGLKKIGLLGHKIMSLGAATIFASVFLPTHWAFGLLLLGTIIYGIGDSVYTGGWFPIIKGQIHPKERGRFFGKLRTFWNFTAFLFTLASFELLRRFDTDLAFSVIFAVIAGGVFMRFLLYAKLPEDWQPPAEKSNLFAAIKEALSQPGLLRFVIYTTMLFMTTGYVPWLLGFQVDKGLGYGEAELVFLGNALFIGTIVGCAVGGYIVDHIGTKMVFLVGHMSFAFVMMLTLFHSETFLSPLWFLSLCSAAFGIIRAVVSIAATAETMNLIGGRFQSICSSTYSASIYASTGLGALLAASLLEAGIINESWTLFGISLNQYDGLMFLSAIIIALLALTLPLIPSVFKPGEERLSGPYVR